MGGDGRGRGRGWLRVEVTRGAAVESFHDVDLAAVDGGGRVVARAGRPGTPVFARSAIKPFQALPLVADGGADRLGVTDAELSLCCGSHSGEPAHVEAARSILDRIGLDEGALACGPHAPFDRASARALREAGLSPGRLHNNCSGKHAGMLALARSNDWPTEGYHRSGHPVQERVAGELARWAAIPIEDMGRAVDGCGAVTFALAPIALASAVARLGDAASRGEPAAARIVHAMAANPFMVGGTDRLCTRLAEATGGRVLAKVGAEGVYVALALGRGPGPALGLALKVRDGARRAAEVALLAALAELGILNDDERAALAQWAGPQIRNTRDEAVGGIRAIADLAEGDGSDG